MAKPIHEVRIGLIKARIWRKRTRSGPRHSTTVVRLYRNGDVWKESTRFGREDLPVVRLVLDRAHTWVLANSRTCDEAAKPKIAMPPHVPQPGPTAATTAQEEKCNGSREP